MNERMIAELAAALGVTLAPDRLAAVAGQLEGQIAGQGGLPPEELDGIEPALVFDPGWDE